MKDIKVGHTSAMININYEYLFFSLIDLALLFKLVSRIPHATNELKKIVESHIYDMGINTIERVSATALNVS